jgi:cation diffusion facilitator CzcD-associated flavoprotein CzcO
MSTRTAPLAEAGATAPPQDAGHFDVLVVGAGISGIGAGLPPARPQCPSKRSVILEVAGQIRRHLETHRYPGIRSDSDLYTFGYRFKPWVGPPIATAEQILAYLGEVIEENGLRRSTSATGTGSNRAQLVRRDDNLLDDRRASHRHRRAYALHRATSCGCARATTTTPRATRRSGPAWTDFEGRIVHPQTWPRGPRLHRQARAS